MDPTSAEVSARARKARAVQFLAPDDPRRHEAVRLYAVERSCTVLADLFADCPPLLPGEYDRIVSLIPGHDRLAVSA